MKKTAFEMFDFYDYGSCIMFIRTLGAMLCGI